MEEKNENAELFDDILIAFAFVWGLGNVVNNFVTRDRCNYRKHYFSDLPVSPYYYVGQLSSTFQDGEGSQ